MITLWEGAVLPGGGAAPFYWDIFNKWMPQRFNKRMLRYPTFVDQWPRRERRILTTLIFILLLGFLILSAIVAFLPTSVVDIEFTERFQRARNPWLDSLMKFVSWFGYMPQGAIVVIGTVVLFFLLGRPREGWFMLATALCLPIVFAIKFAFGRMRPRAELWDDFLSGTAYQSFPSGHVALYVTFFGFLIFLMYRLRRYPQPLRLLIASFCIILIALVPVSRVYLGATGSPMSWRVSSWGCCV